MAKIIKEAERKEIIEFSHDYHWEDDPGSGFTFPCDATGNLLPEVTEEGLKNYEKCRSGEMTRDGHKLVDEGVVKRRRSYKEPAILQCTCGEKFELIDSYLGACKCPKCSQWYNLFGQQLVDPDYWEEEREDY